MFYNRTFIYHNLVQQFWPLVGKGLEIISSGQRNVVDLRKKFNPFHPNGYHYQPSENERLILELFKVREKKNKTYPVKCPNVFEKDFRHVDRYLVVFFSPRRTYVYNFFLLSINYFLIKLFFRKTNSTTFNRKCLEIFMFVNS